MSKNCPGTWRSIFRFHQKRETATFSPIAAHNDWVHEFFVKESLPMERIGQIFEDYSIFFDYLVILYRPLDRGKSKEIWHIVAIRHKHQSHNDRWHAAGGWMYSPYERPRNRYDRRQLTLF